MDFLTISRAALAQSVRAANTKARDAWLLRFTDHEPIEVYFAPAQTHEQVVTEWYQAVAAEPVQPQ